MLIKNCVIINNNIDESQKISDFFKKNSLSKNVLKFTPENKNIDAILEYSPELLIVNEKINSLFINSLRLKLQPNQVLFFLMNEFEETNSGISSMQINSLNSNIKQIYLSKLFNNTFAFLKLNNENKLNVRQRKIIYTSGNSKECTIFTKNESYQYNDISLDIIEEELSGYTFLKVHQNYIINLEEIDSIYASHVVLNGNKTIPIGKDFKSMTHYVLNLLFDLEIERHFH